MAKESDVHHFGKSVHYLDIISNTKLVNEYITNKVRWNREREREREKRTEREKRRRIRRKGQRRGLLASVQRG